METKSRLVPKYGYVYRYIVYVHFTLKQQCPDSEEMAESVVRALALTWVWIPKTQVNAQ